MSSNNMIYNIEDDPFLEVSSQKPSTFSKSQTYPLSAKSYPILIKLLLISNQSKKFQSHSSAELSLLFFKVEIYKFQMWTPWYYEEGVWDHPVTLKPRRIKGEGGKCEINEAAHHHHQKCMRDDIIFTFHEVKIFK